MSDNYINLQESVPAALTKDKKRIDGQEVQVSPVWQSTLYITNFPETFVAADLQSLFEPVRIFIACLWVSVLIPIRACPVWDYFRNSLAESTFESNPKICICTIC
jgi:hypothetical protein